jgi:hypothetical protein
VHDPNDWLTRFSHRLAQLKFLLFELAMFVVFIVWLWDHVVRHWDIYNPREKGGIAKPAVFIIDQDRMVRYAAVDTVMRRVSAAEIVCLLQAAAEATPVRRRVLLPRLSDWLSAIRNSIRR